jgi:hypothetical protein
MMVTKSQSLPLRQRWGREWGVAVAGVAHQRPVNVLTGLRNPTQRLTCMRRIRFGRQTSERNDRGKPLVAVHDKHPAHLDVCHILGACSSSSRMPRPASPKRQAETPVIRRRRAGAPGRPCRRAGAVSARTLWRRRGPTLARSPASCSTAPSPARQCYYLSRSSVW